MYDDQEKSKMINESDNGVNDLVIYQQDYASSFRSWLFAEKHPKWDYNEPTEVLSKRGLNVDRLRDAIDDINEIAIVSFDAAYHKCNVFAKILSILCVTVCLILLMIPHASTQGSALMIILLVILTNLAHWKYFKPIDTAILCALRAVSNHVKVTLNFRYQLDNICWGSVETIVIRKCQPYRSIRKLNITVRCTDEVLTDDDKATPFSDDIDDVINALNASISESDSSTSNSFPNDNVADGVQDDEMKNISQEQSVSESNPEEAEIIINTPLIIKMAPKENQYNWAQTVGKKRDTWIDPYQAEQNEDAEEQPNTE
eukprot:902993_1